MNDLLLGIDIGSTTTKLALIKCGEIIYSKYQRHFSQVRQTTLEMLRNMEKEIGDIGEVRVTVSGSAGMGLADAAGLAFIQEVYATGEMVHRYAPDTSVVIELGGEDAKVIFFDGGIDERMNGSCAGGTGAFIDQMAVLLDTTVDEMDKMSLEATKIYPIASRCGVFAKTDIQPLLNQGAKKSDIAASIYQAVVNQTITGLVQGRKIKGKVMFLGGPLYYCEGLKKRFCETLKLGNDTAVFPEYALFSVAIGAAMHSEKVEPIKFCELTERINNCVQKNSNDNRLDPLFKDKSEYSEFIQRHKKASVPVEDITAYRGNAWLGIDCGSTTTKLVLIGENKQILYTYYSGNKGNPVNIVLDELKKIYAACGERITICGSSVTGYGEELIKHAFNIDEGIVETIAHYTAAKYFKPDVDFILDIGGQDIKCFKIRNGAIDSIMLNEACSSGCGSFIETFAKSMGYDVSDFAKKAIFSTAPVNLGTRCTVFMNSSVKQSQKDGASVEDISAGLSVSVVKNALYKVIRANSPSELGKNVVVQGGTFYNDAVLRAFEKELGADVIRPSIAGLMGAYGAALHAMHYNKSGILSLDELNDFSHKSTTAVCNGCENHCHLTINIFSDGQKFISGNQCNKGSGLKITEKLPDLYEYKREFLSSLKGKSGPRGRIGLPMALGMYELAPLWHTVFTKLGYETVFSNLSTRRTYELGQFTIPSDTACYPAKIMHGHIEELVKGGVDFIFYPCLTYNVEEKSGDNHFNCPIVAYYSELLNANVDDLSNVHFLYPHLNINSKRTLAENLRDCLAAVTPGIKLREVRDAVKAGFKAYDEYMAGIKCEGEKALRYAKTHNKRVMILAGRPYHIDPEICHGIDRLATSLGFVVVSEDSVCHLEKPQQVHILNQWTYHARLYRAAKLAADNSNMQLVQLVSFGCGLDAITTDEIRSILEGNGKYYTQIKIDEITNLGAVKIRLRSLMGALEEKGE